MSGMEPEYQKIGRRIKLMRVAKDMSQAELARCLGITQTGLSTIEHGKSRVTLRRLFQLRDILGCKMSDFFEEEEEEKPDENDVSLDEVLEAMQIMKQIKLAKTDENFSTGKEIPSVVKKHSRVERKYKEVIKQ